MPKLNTHLDVHWYVPNRKRPAFYTTKADSDMFCLCVEDTMKAHGKQWVTVAEVEEWILNETCAYNSDIGGLLEVLEKHKVLLSVGEHFGDVLIKEMK